MKGHLERLKARGVEAIDQSADYKERKGAGFGFAACVARTKPLPLTPPYTKSQTDIGDVRLGVRHLT